MTKESPYLSSRDVETVAARLRASGMPHAMATVVRTLSSTAAKPGMKALVLDNGEFAEGWLGGSCVTSAVQRAAKEAIRSGEATLVCLRPEELIADQDGAEQGGEGMVTLARNGCPSKGSMDIFVEPVVPQPELLVFGYGPVARALLRIAAGFGFTIASYGAADGDVAPTADRHYTTAEELAASGNTRRFIVVATQGAGDVASLTAALPLGAEYLAFVGSRRKFASYRDRLIAAGMAAELIGDVRSPAGLHIDAVTPEEIALSIMAEIVRTRRSTSRLEAAHG